MKDRYGLIIIGAGAAGLAAAVKAAEKGLKVLLLEKSDRPGRKILASGNGRCNLMNLLPGQYHGDGSFADAVLRRCGPVDLQSFFRHLGLLVREEEDGRVYPVTNQSASVLSSLRSGAEAAGARLALSRAVQSAEKRADGTFRLRSGSEEYAAEKVLVACGGAAQPKLGGCEDGYRLLTSFGHGMIPVKPALVPASAGGKSVSGLSGIRAKCRITLKNGNGASVREERGEILFTDYGVSGICVMQCARGINSGADTFEIDFLDPVFRTAEAAEAEIRDRVERFADRKALSLLEGILVPKLAFAVMKQAGMPMRDERIRDIPQEFVERILYAASHYRVSDLRPRGLDQAQVTAGGIDCGEFSPLTMESRLVPGLYAAGEVLNVDGDCGGYNLMFAFASGIVAAEHAAEER